MLAYELGIENNEQKSRRRQTSTSCNFTMCNSSERTQLQQTPLEKGKRRRGGRACVKQTRKTGEQRKEKKEV